MKILILLSVVTYGQAYFTMTPPKEAERYTNYMFRINVERATCWKFYYNGIMIDSLISQDKCVKSFANYGNYTVEANVVFNGWVDTLFYDFKITDLSGIKEISKNKEPIKYYDLYGRRVIYPKNNTLYITNKRTYEYFKNNR